MGRYFRFSLACLLFAFIISCTSSDEDKKLTFQLDKPYREIMQGSTLRDFSLSRTQRILFICAVTPLPYIGMSGLPFSRGYMRLS